MCTTPGTSGTNEPQGYGEGDEITDGTCVWKLKLFVQIVKLLAIVQK